MKRIATAAFCLYGFAGLGTALAIQTEDPPPVQEYRNCTLMREAGWNRGVNRGGGTYREAWDEAEKETYGLNTSRDRDKDGHACER